VPSSLGNLVYEKVQSDHDEQEDEGSGIGFFGRFALARW
jgi:hypothetical protein